MKKQTSFISVVMPCLNEEKTVGICVKKALQGIKSSGFKGEVVVADNGSIDKSVNIATKAGARVVREKIKGYGSAYLAGIKAAKGDWIVIGDSDDTYNFRQIPKLITPLKNGADLVLGSRLKGQLESGSMPWLNRNLGTPLLNLFIRIFYNIKISDSQSGMRAFSKKTYCRLNLQTTGMEFASEMLIRAAQEGMSIDEVPISYSRRIAPTKLSRFKDAWRHIRFMLLFAPTQLFLIPGAVFMGIGLLGLFLIALAPINIFGRILDIHSLILASMLTLLGYQIIMLGIYAKTFGWTTGFVKGGLVINTTLKFYNLERGLATGFIISVVGLLIGVVSFIGWARAGFGQLQAIRPAVVAMTLFVLGIQIVFSSFFLSVLGIKQKKK